MPVSCLEEAEVFAFDPIHHSLGSENWEDVTINLDRDIDPDELMRLYEPDYATIYLWDGHKYHWNIEFWTTQGEFMIAHFYCDYMPINWKDGWSAWIITRYEACTCIMSDSETIDSEDPQPCEQHRYGTTILRYTGKRVLLIRYLRDQLLPSFKSQSVVSRPILNPNTIKSPLNQIEICQELGLNNWEEIDLPLFEHRNDLYPIIAETQRMIGYDQNCWVGQFWTQQGDFMVVSFKIWDEYRFTWQGGWERLNNTYVVRYIGGRKQLVKHLMRQILPLSYFK